MRRVIEERDTMFSELRVANSNIFELVKMKNKSRFPSVFSATLYTFSTTNEIIERKERIKKEKRVKGTLTPIETKSLVAANASSRVCNYTYRSSQIEIAFTIEDSSKRQ